MKILIFLITVLITRYATASGIITLDGKLYAKTKDAFVILVKSQLYTLKKEKLSKDQFSLLDEARWEAPVNLQVPMTAIAQVKDK
jgi:hypothetical protein